MKNIASLMKQAGQMQAKMQEMQARLDATSLEGSAGNGLVKITLTGKGEMTAIVIDPRLLDPSDADTLQDLILAAHRDAKTRLDAMMKAEMSRVTGGLNLPPGLLPF